MVPLEVEAADDAEARMAFPLSCTDLAVSLAEDLMLSDRFLSAADE